MLEDLDKILQFKSLLSDNVSHNAPFGQEIADTLDFFLQRGRDYGLKAVNVDGYCGYVEYGEGEEMIGVLCHLDVVPKGDGDWSYPAYKLTIDDGYLYGRGVVDNKGPAIIMLHILKNLKDNNIKLNHRIRLIVGCNEESGSLCIKHYKKTQEIPKFSIVPDCDFPVINGEKEILHLSISLPAPRILQDCCSIIKSGQRANVVPDKANVVIAKDSYLSEIILKSISNNGVDFDKNLTAYIFSEGFSVSDFTISMFEETIEIETRGVAGHAMSPEKGDNAIWKMFALLTYFEKEYGTTEIEFLYNKLCTSMAKERLGIDFADDISGDLTMNIGIVNFIKTSALDFTLDFRIPLTKNGKDIIDSLNNIFENANITIKQNSNSLYFPADSKLVTTLVDIYNSFTGEKREPIVMGGGTYARELPNAIGFGPTFPDTVTNIHNIDERISILQFDKLFELYYNAIIMLDKIENV